MLDEPDYPALLAELDTAPPALIIRGDIGLAQRGGVALVGARNASAASCRFARGLAQDLAAQRAHFETLLDPEKYAESVARGERRLSHRAMQAALFITLFQREPGLQLPYRLLSALLSMDEQLCAWLARRWASTSSLRSAWRTSVR